MAFVKRAQLRISLAVLEDLVLGRADRWAAASTDAPEDLRVVGVQQPEHAIGDWCYLIVESAKFKPIPEGGIMPNVGPYHYHRAEEVEA
jgi:hypothetical protein